MEEPVNLDSLMNPKIQIILRQTDYSECKAMEKLLEFQMDELLVIKDFLGIPSKKKEETFQSINQEIYKQIRFRLDSCRKDFESRKEANQTKLK